MRLIHFAHLHFVLSAVKEASHQCLQFANLGYVQPLHHAVGVSEVEMLTRSAHHRGEALTS